MPYIEGVIAAESNTSSSRDELSMLVSAQYKGRLAQAIIDRLYHNHLSLFKSLINVHPRHLGEYSFGLIERAFAEHFVATTRLNKGLSRYFINTPVPDTEYKINIRGVDVVMYLSREWYAITRAKPGVNHDQAAINDLIRVLNTCFGAHFVYIVTDDADNRHQLWGPSGTL